MPIHAMPPRCLHKAPPQGLLQWQGGQENSLKAEHHSLTRWLWRTSTWTSTRARSPPSSATTAPARPPPCELLLVLPISYIVYWVVAKFDVAPELLAWPSIGLWCKSRGGGVVQMWGGTESSPTHWPHYAHIGQQSTSASTQILDLKEILNWEKSKLRLGVKAANESKILCRTQCVHSVYCQRVKIWSKWGWWGWVDAKFGLIKIGQ